MLLNDYMKKRLKRLDKIASDQPKRSLEEALADYDKLEELAGQETPEPSVFYRKKSYSKKA